MMRLQESLGVYLQKDKIVIASLSKGFKSISLSAFHVIYGTSKLEQKDIAEKVRGFLKNKKISPDFITLGVGRSVVIQRNVVLPTVEDANIRDMLEFEIDHCIPCPKDDIYFDFHVASKTETNTELFLVGIKKETLDYYFEIFKMAGLKITSMDLSYFGNHNIILHNNPELEGKQFLCVDFGEEEVEYSYFDDNRLCFSRSHSTAHYTKKVSSDNQNSNAEEELIRALLKDIDMSLKTVSKNINGDMSKVILCGEADIESFKTPIEEALDVPVSINRTFCKVEKSDTARNNTSGDSVCLGLALKPFMNKAPGLNLLPQHLRIKERKVGLIFFLILVAVNLGLGVGIPASKIVKQKVYLKELRQQSTDFRKKLEQVEELKTKSNKGEAFLKNFAEIKKRDLGVLDIFLELSERIPSSAWVNRFNTTKDGFEILGHAKSASSLISILEESPLFENVQFSQPITVRKDKTERFKISFSLKHTAGKVVEKKK